ncbi:hypothetical protein [Pseudomonas sp. LB3P14]
MREIERRGACSTAETYRTCLNQFFRYAIVEGGLDINPAVDLDSVAVLRRIGRQRCALRLRCRGGRLTFAVHGQLSLWARSVISRWAGAVALPWRHEGVGRPRSRRRLPRDRTRHGAGF